MDQKSFPEKIQEVITGPPKRTVPITFPEIVFNEFSDFAKENSANCYWLAIKHLLDFYKKQIEEDIKLKLIMSQINGLQEQIDELYKIQKKEIKTEPKTFGQKE